jgi:hypothetical protein
VSDVPIERIVALDLKPTDLVVIETGPGPLSNEMADRIVAQWKASGIKNRLLVMQGGMKLHVSLRDEAFVYTPESHP